MKRALSCGLLLWALVAAVVFACSSSVLRNFCTEIPDGGCPAGAAGADASNCVDPLCAALYSPDQNCNWTLVQECPDYKPPMDAGHPDAWADADARVPLDAHLRDAGVILPDTNASACDVDLQSPDCTPQEAVLGPSCNGCESLYVCEDGGWNLWGEYLWGECYAEAGTTIVPVTP
jgi:hypothetical protein